MTVRFEDPAGNLSPSGPALAVTVDTTAPAVVSRSFDRARTHALRFAFTENVGASLSTADLSVENLNTRTTIAPALMARQFSANTGVFTFPGFPGQLLPDAFYRATLSNAAVTDAAGNALAAASVLDFHVFAADASGDAVVDFNDLAILAQNYNTIGGMTFDKGDFNYDGNVDFNDLALLAQRYNTSLPPPSPAAAAGAAGRDAMPPKPVAAKAQASAPQAVAGVFNSRVPVNRPRAKAARSAP
jgi:hypothetical protein